MSEELLWTVAVPVGLRIPSAKDVTHVSHPRPGDSSIFEYWDSFYQSSTLSVEKVFCSKFNVSDYPEVPVLRLYIYGLEVSSEVVKRNIFISIDPSCYQMQNTLVYFALHLCFVALHI